jgi:hypothetical protein
MISYLLYHNVPFRIKILYQNELELKGILQWDLSTKALFTLIERANKDVLGNHIEALSPMELVREKYEKSPWEIEKGGIKIKCIEVSRNENGEVLFSVSPF